MKTIRKTSPEVVKQLTKHVEVSYFENVFRENPIQILEPSAGKGDLVKGIQEELEHLCFELDCIELNQLNRLALIKAGFNVISADCMLLDNSHKYDYIIAAPTFKDRFDLKQTMFLYKNLFYNGRMIVIMSTDWLYDHKPIDIEFRYWLNNKKHAMYLLDENSFMEDGHSRNCVILTIDQNEAI